MARFLYSELFKKTLCSFFFFAILGTWGTYSLRLALLRSSIQGIFPHLTMVCKLMPPLSFLRNTMFGGSLLSRNPNPSNSCSMSFLWPSGLRTSSTMKMREHVRATAITWRPRPLPSLAPSIIPGKSKSWKKVKYYIKLENSIYIPPHLMNNILQKKKEQIFFFFRCLIEETVTGKVLSSWNWRENENKIGESQAFQERKSSDQDKISPKCKLNLWPSTISHLNLSTLILDTPRYSGQCGELICCHLRVHPRQGTQQRWLPHRRKPNKSNAGISCFGHIKPFSWASTASFRCDQFTSELSNTGFQ
jgi:hypothetical protein